MLKKEEEKINGCCEERNKEDEGEKNEGYGLNQRRKEEKKYGKDQKGPKKVNRSIRAETKKGGKD